MSAVELVGNVGIVGCGFTTGYSIYLFTRYFRLWIFQRKAKRWEEKKRSLNMIKASLRRPLNG